MHAIDVSKPSDTQEEEKDDGPSVLGRFVWTVVGSSCIPCLLKNDGTKYVSVRIAESKVLSHFLLRLNAEVFSCIRVKSFRVTEAEMKLLNEINNKHCEFTFGRDPFSLDSDFIVRLDDLIEFYQFMDTCYSKLLNGTPAGNKNKCGFVRINDDSVVPYAVKNDQKYVPLFYFEGETESLKTKAINLENWDLAYLKFCCKVQGIKNELFNSDQCMVTSLEDVKSYFPEGTKFDDYWPSKVVEMQTPTRNDINGNHSWVQTPHIDSSAVPQPTVPNASHTMVNKTLPSVMTKPLHSNNNQRGNATAVINNLSSSVYPQGNNTWQASIMGNAVNNAQLGNYQMTQATTSPRLAPKPTPVTMHSMNSNAVASRNYGNPSMRPQYFPSATSNVPSVQPPPLVKAPTAVSNVYTNPTYPQIYSTSAMYSMAPQPHHMNTTPAAMVANNKMRNTPPNQITSNVTRYPPALTPINGTCGIIQTNNQAPVSNNVIMNSRNQRSNFNQDEEVIDLLSPPHSPQHTNSSMMNRHTSVVSNNNNGNRNDNSRGSGKIIQIVEASHKPGVPPFKVQQQTVKDKTVVSINLDAYSSARPAITLYDVRNNYFPDMEISDLINSLLNGTKSDLYHGNSSQLLLLREVHNYRQLNDMEDLILITVEDFDKKYPMLQYISKNNQTKQGGGDAKRQKIS